MLRADENVRTAMQRTLWTPLGKKPVAAFGLDLDGLMRDTGHMAYRALCKAIVERGGKEPTYHDYVYKDSGDSLDFCREYGVAFTQAELDEAYFRHLEPEDDVLPFPDVVDFCARAQKLALPLFVVTANGDAVLDWFSRHRLHIHFDTIIHSASPKELYLKGWCLESSVEPAQVAYAGDRARDIHAAHAAECISVGVCRGYAGADTALKKAGAQLVVRSLEHLAHLVS